MLMAPIIAQKLLDAIDAAIVAEGGAKRLYDLFDQQCDTDPIEYFESSGKCLGASSEGHPCLRSVWLGFRWASPRRVSAKGTRIFHRGSIEELRLRSYLLLAGVTLRTPKQLDAKGQNRYFDAHKAGANDGAVFGVPDMPNEPMLLEGKAINSATFEKLTKLVGGIPQGLKIGKPDHYTQVQRYLSQFSNKRGPYQFALYVAVNKDSEELYAEIVPRDEYEISRIDASAKIVIFGTQAPDRIGGPAHYICKSMCDHQAVCQGGEAPIKSCRTCTHFGVTPRDCVCETFAKKLTHDQQKAACPSWLVHPSFAK